MTNQPTPFANGLKRCTCARFTNVDTGEHTGCAQGTKGRFAPGHDAKLKKLLIAAGANGQRVAIDGTEGEFLVEELLESFPGLADKVQAGIYNARRTAKPAKVATPAPAPIEIIEIPIKSGKATKFRAEYEGVIATRSSKTRAYTHAAVYQFAGEVPFIGSWHASAALAAKGANGWKPIAVVPVTVAK